MVETKLRVENVTKRYGDEVAVDDLSFTIEDGKIKSLLGPSGCGKTTTLRCIAGLEDLDSGRIYIDGDLVSDPDQGLNLPPKLRGIGMVFQSYALWPHMTVRENVEFPLNYQDVDLTGDEKRERVEELLQTVGLEAHIDDLSSQLSGGQQQRVALARALVVEPEVLLMDEPLSSLDAKLRREMRKEVQSICRSLGITVLYVTHAQDEAMFISDQIALMDEGKIVEEGAPAELYEQPRSFFGMNFMGHCNHLSCTITDARDGRLTIETPMGRYAMDSTDESFRDGEHVSLCVRPKHCRILLDDIPAAKSTDKRGAIERSEIRDVKNQVFEGRIVSTGTTRDFTEYEIEFEGRETSVKDFLVRTPEPLPIQYDDMARVYLPSKNVRIFSSEAEQATPQEEPIVEAT